MKMLNILLCLMLAVPVVQAKEKVDEKVWGPMMARGVPQWAKDAKFGIYAHWGVYSVSGAWDYASPNWANDYICAYQRFYHTNPKNHMRVQFEKNVGPIAEGFGYKDLAKQFTAEKFDPDYWADLMVRSGAKYAGICAIHHDGYAMWDSDVIDFCAGKLGPQRDLLGEMMAAIKDRGLKTFTSFHHARTYKQFQNITKRLKSKPALAQADVGIAMGGGTDVAIESAGVTLLNSDLTSITRARALSAKTMANIRQNLVFAFGYNALGVPIAAGILYPHFGILLSPVIAAAVSNTWRRERFRWWLIWFEGITRLRLLGDYCRPRPRPR